MKHIPYLAFLTLLFIGSSAFSQTLKFEYDTMMARLTAYIEDYENDYSW